MILTFLRTWETLPKYIRVQGTHGCARVTVNGSDYLVVMGGVDGISMFSDINFYNIAKKVWEVYSSKIYLPTMVGRVQATIALQLDYLGCNMMILYFWPFPRLHVCEGNYNWRWIDATGKNDLNINYATVGANELLPCGVNP
jgi:hypothetical protein